MAMIRERSEEQHARATRIYSVDGAVTLRSCTIQTTEQQQEPDAADVQAPQRPAGLVGRLRAWSWRVFYNVFLPEGYPASVSEDYAEYQRWDTIQALASSLSGQLSTLAVLEGLGVGTAEKTATNATLQWLTMDGTSMISRLLFAWGFSQQLDQNTKVTMWSYARVDHTATPRLIVRA